MLNISKFEKLANDALNSANPLIRELGQQLQLNSNEQKPDDVVVDPHLQKLDKQVGSEHPLQQEDLVFQNIMPELEENEKDDQSPFGSLKANNIINQWYSSQKSAGVKSIYSVLKARYK